MANTKGAYLAAMMGGGGGIIGWMIGEVATEDEDEEGLDSTRGSGLQFSSGRHNFRGSGLQNGWVENDSSHKTIRPCSNQALLGKGVKVRVLKGNEFP
jgi:hypothetical protein